MNVGVAQVTLRLPENGSLKGKRQVVKSIISRVQSRYHVAIAETDNQDRWQIATLGIACLSNDRRHTNEVLSRVVDYIDQCRGEAEMVDYEIEIIAAF